MHTDKVFILLSTYNGSKYLDDQINSILNQTYSNWQLVIRDDGSIDDTCKIVEHFLNIDNRITLLMDNSGNLKSCQSFFALMDHVKPIANYVMFCDQDDIWKPEKVELSLKKIKQDEVILGTNVSLLVYSSYQLMSENGAIIPTKPPIYPANPKLNLLLAENYIYGCTTIINKHLLNKAVPISINAENHDYWIALAALATNGNISYINSPLLLYRQHQNNVSGSYKNASFIKRFMRLKANESNITVKRRAKMFEDIFSQYKDELSPSNYEIISQYIKYVSKGGLRSVQYCIKNNIRKVGFLQTIPYYIGILKG